MTPTPVTPATGDLFDTLSRVLPPQETIFGMGPGPSNLPQLFSSDHVEEAVPLQAVQRKVAVRYSSAGGQATSTASNSGAAEPWDAIRADEALGAPAFECCFHYDHRVMMLGLPRPT